MQQRLSLKARAIQLLSQREHSRLELRRKLLRHAIAACRPQAVDPLSVVDDSGDVAVDDPVDEDVDPGPCLDKLLDWLEAHQYLSEERFVESRVHARQSRFGTRRITQELAQHGVSADSATVASLRDTEVERACDVWRRKFAEPARTAAEHAKQTRFLLLRGFSGDAVRAAVGRLKAAPADEGTEPAD